MSRAKPWTPGPWGVEQHDSLADANDAGAFLWCGGWKPEWGKPSEVYRVVDGAGSITGLPGCIETTEPNARLIAKAPTLVERLEAAIGIIDDHAEYGDVLDEGESEDLENCRKLLAEIYGDDQ